MLTLPQRGCPYRESVACSIPSNDEDNDNDNDEGTMDFEHYGGQVGSSSADQPKRRRRRNAARRLLRNKAPISARLTLDPQLRGSIGQVSDDLVKDLFQLRDLTGKWCFTWLISHEDMSLG